MATKTKSISGARKAAWKEFSRFIRLRDCLETTGSTKYGVCFTCGQTVPCQELHAGHYIDGRTNGLLFNELGTHAQCAECNIAKGGNKKIYKRKMLARYGGKVVESLEQLRHLPVKYKAFDFYMERERYKRKADELLAGEEA